MQSKERSEFDQRLTAAIGADGDELIEQTRRVSNDADRAAANVAYLENLRKVVWSEEREKARADFAQDGEKVSEARLDDLAYSSPRFRQHLDETRDESLRAASLQALKWAGVNNVSLHLAKVAVHRSEMSAYGPDAKPQASGAPAPHQEAAAPAREAAPEAPPPQVPYAKLYRKEGEPRGYSLEGWSQYVEWAREIMHHAAPDLEKRNPQKFRAGLVYYLDHDPEPVAQEAA